MTDPTQPHDALFKQTFSQVAHAAAELRAVLPPALVAQIDFSTLTLCSGSYIDRALLGSESDLLFSVKIAEKPAYLYLLFEHQSRPDLLMALRLLGYVLRILNDHVTNAETPSRALPLPLVIPVVLYHGEGRWSAAVRLEDLFDSDLITKAAAHDLVPRLSFVLDDLTDQTDEALEARHMGLEALLALWVLRDARNRRRLEAAVEHWVPALARLLDGPNGRQAIWTLFRYIVAVADEAAAQSLAQALQARKPEAKEAIMTLAEKWFTEGKAEGRAEGKAEGRAEGKAEGKAETLRKLLTLKFGDVPQPILYRLASASEPELDRFIERLLSAGTIDEALL